MNFLAYSPVLRRAFLIVIIKNMQYHFHEHFLRSILKTATFRLSVIAIDFAFLYFITHDVRITSTILGFAIVLHTIIYFLHERAWNRIHYGKRHLDMQNVIEN